MSNLTVFNKEGLEILVNQYNGESFCTPSSYAKIANKTVRAIRARLQGRKLNEVKTAEIPTAGGLQGVKLICEDLICEWLPKDNPEIAGRLLKLGVRGFLHQLAGYTVTSSAIVPQSAPTYYLGMVCEEPKNWSLHFDAEFRFHACRLTGYEWDWRCMAGFINATVYTYLPREARFDLDRVNPCLNGQRPRKQHQHLTIDAQLREHINQVKTCMRLSKSIQEFWDNMQTNFHGALQLDLF